MINLSASAEYLSVVLHFMACTMLLCGLFIWLQRKENLHQRILLSITLFICGAGIMFRALATYKIGIPSSYPALSINELYAGLWEVSLLFLYPVETVNPGWLRRRGFLVLFMPILIISAILLLVPMEFRELHSYSDILAYIHEPNVWFRLIILFVFIIPLIMLLLCLPYNWRRSSVDAKWVRFYAVGMQGIGLFYLCFMLTGSVTMRAVHLTYCTLFFIYITYQELYLRLFPDTAKTSASGAPSEIPTVMYAEQNQHILPQEPLLERFTYYMSTEQPWRSPNLTVGDVAKAIGVSRTKLSTDISAEGNDSFHTLVARYRIAAFCEMVQRGEVENVNEALFAVGFRSRSTAYDRFKEQTGMTPADYIKTIKTGEA